MAVLVDHTTEDRRPPNRASRAGSLSLAAVDRRAFLESTARSVGVVVLDVLLDQTTKVMLVDNEESVEAFATNRADPRFGVCVGSRCPDWCPDHVDIQCGEHRVECSGELGVTVANQEPERVGAVN
jgi:hypothetical protein